MWRRPAAGSSSSSRTGSRHSARAISTILSCPSDRLPAGRCMCCREPHALDLPRGLVQRRASSVRSRRAMLEAAPLRPRRCAPSATFSSTLMLGSTLTCWNVRPMPRRATAWAERPEIALALEGDLARGRPQHTGHQVEDGALAGAVGADQADDLARAHVEADIVDGNEPAERPCARRLERQQRLARLAALPARRAARPSGGRGGSARAGISAARRGHSPSRAVCSNTHQQGSEHDRLVVAFAAEQWPAGCAAAGP